MSPGIDPTVGADDSAARTPVTKTTQAGWIGAWGGAEPRPYGQNHAPPQPTTPFINAVPCHGAPSRRALRIALPPQPRQPARRDTQVPPYGETDAAMITP